MKYAIEFGKVAESELRGAVAFYHDISKELAARFQSQFDLLIEEILTNPKRYPIDRGNRRQAIMLDFPYCFYYRVQHDRVYISAVYHHSRDPASLRNRK